MGTNPIPLVRERLDGGKNWIKGSYVGEGDGVCLSMACTLVERYLDDFNVLAIGVIEARIGKIIAEQYFDRVDDLAQFNASIPVFNDHPDTTWDDIEVVLDKAEQLTW